MRFHSHHVLHALCVVLLLAAACAADDSDGGTSDTGGSDTERDLGDTGNPGLDVGPRPDQGGGDVGQDAAPDVAPDTGVPDTAGEPDTVEPACGGLSEACCAGTCDGALICSGNLCIEDLVVCEGEPACIEPPGGTPDVPIVQRSGAPPTLLGGAIVDGDYELDLIELYTDGTVSILVTTFDVTSNGDTSGSLVFEGTDWGFEANLDLFIDVEAVGQTFAQAIQQDLAAGGCYNAVGNELRGDLTQCGATWPEGAEPPDSLDYEVTEGGVQLLLTLTREMIIAAIPEEQRDLAGFAIVGGLPVLLTFSEVP